MSKQSIKSAARRTLALVLCLCMAFSGLTLPAYADDVDVEGKPRNDTDMQVIIGYWHPGQPEDIKEKHLTGEPGAKPVTIKDTVTENGTVTVTNTETVKGEEVTYSITWNEASRLVTWDLGDRGTSEHGVVTMVVRVNARDIQQLENQATVTVGVQSALTNKVDNKTSVGSLYISKAVEAEDKDMEAAKQEQFTFRVTLTAPGVSQDAWTYNYQVYDETGKEVGTSQPPLSTEHNTLTLKHGQYAVIEGIPAGVTYTVTEENAAGYAVDVTVSEGDGKTAPSGATGTILPDNAGATPADKAANKVAFTNTKGVAVATLQVEKSLTVTGDAPEKDDRTFTFSLTPEAANSDDDPVKAAIKKQNDAGIKGDSLQVTAENVGPDKNVTATFGTFRYTAAGTYGYTLQEVIPEPEKAVPGMTYDKRVHTVVVTVTDKEGVLTAAVKVDEGEEQTDGPFTLPGP